MLTSNQIRDKIVNEPTQNDIIAFTIACAKSQVNVQTRVVNTPNDVRSRVLIEEIGQNEPIILTTAEFDHELSPEGCVLKGLEISRILDGRKIPTDKTTTQ